VTLPLDRAFSAGGKKKKGEKKKKKVPGRESGPKLAIRDSGASEKERRKGGIGGGKRKGRAARETPPVYHLSIATIGAIDIRKKKEKDRAEGEGVGLAAAAALSFFDHRAVRGMEEKRGNTRFASEG